MSNQNKGNEARADVAMPLTREGLFAYFDQMSDKDGRINTTAQWLADVGMLIVHDTNKAHHATANADLAAALAFEAGQRAKALEIADELVEMTESMSKNSPEGFAFQNYIEKLKENENG